MKVPMIAAVFLAFVAFVGLTGFDGCDINIGEKNLPHSGDDSGDTTTPTE
jgi:hypothetical protein